MTTMQEDPNNNTKRPNNNDTKGRPKQQCKKVKQQCKKNHANEKDSTYKVTKLPPLTYNTKNKLSN
jgi:hypothetical protein